jgi:formylmethanofuran dehydrogenase subunit E
MRDFQGLLKEAVAHHGHFCSGQVLGVRLAMRGLAELGIDPELEGKRLIVYVEIDRCAADAVASVTRCSLGKRTLKYAEYGKMAATFVDTQTDYAVRVVALDSARERARMYAGSDLPKSEAQIIAYQAMPDAELFNVQHVSVTISKFDLPGHPLTRVTCTRCGEGVNDGREVVQGDAALCRACAGNSYYALLGDPVGERNSANVK